MAFHRHTSIFLSLLIVLFETGLVKLAEVGYLKDHQNFEIPSVLSYQEAQYKSESSSKQKRLEISSFKTENRKTEKNKEIIKTNTTTPPVKDSLETALYRVKAADDSTCIKLKVDAILSFKYLTKLNEIQDKETFIPTGATVTGDCSDEDKQNLVLRWHSFVLKWYFSKTPGGERWFVPKIELKYDPSDSFFEHIKSSGRSSFTLSSSSSHSNYLFPTPVGKSYKCDREIEVELTSSQTHTVASLFLRDFKVEPFIFKNDEFGPEYMCAATGSGTYRSETAPLIVGSMLAAACLLTISGYAIYRYFNIEKVQYDTME
ncbi:unnamed protein product [Nezara viridula]|uniref:Lysosome-associated membrane glycoprotein 2-like luminal domain-containing protein n=1 Tax=Nezara viridula TaxID=85310 RepID=A0A9P0H7U6_NEZVI|nr:unnamed protein product [Nezara viridula]